MLSGQSLIEPISKIINVEAYRSRGGTQAKSHETQLINNKSLDLGLDQKNPVNGFKKIINIFEQFQCFK